MQIAPELLDQIVAHAERDKPHECCGVVIARDGVAERVVELENLAHSGMRFEVDGLVLHHLLEEAEDGGAELGAIYHSHPRSPAEPSQTDINFAVNWPGVEWIIASGKAGEVSPRSWLIEDGTAREVELVVAATPG